MIPISHLDLFTLALYLVATAIFGASFFKRRASAKEYFLGGGKMGWIPIGISILAADLSAISVMGSPAWVYKHDLSLLWVTVGYPLVAPLVVLVFAPFYARLHLYTAYEYLERRFDLRVRLVASILFQMLRAWHVAVAIYGPSLILHLVTGFSMWKCIVTMGAFTTFYTTLGGMKAVIWTDVIQFATVMGGILAVIVVGIRGVPGGMLATWRLAEEGGRLHFINLALDPHQTTTLWACLIGGSFLALGPLTTDQAILQRLFATRTARDFRQSVMLQAILIVPVIGSLNLVGVILYAFYQAHPAQLLRLSNPDAIVPFFVLTELPRGVAGLVIAGIFAASMAVMSAGVNALTTATTVDIYARILRPGRSDVHYAAAGRIGTSLWGCVVTLLAVFAGRAGDLATAYSRVSSVLVGPMLGIFMLGILSGRANGVGVLSGAVIGGALTSAVSLGSSWSFLYLGAIGTLVTALAGYLISLLFERSDSAHLQGLTIRRHPKTES